MIIIVILCTEVLAKNHYDCVNVFHMFSCVLALKVFWVLFKPKTKSLINSIGIFDFTFLSFSNQSDLYINKEVFKVQQNVKDLPH